VDDHLRTTNPRVFAAGDIASRYQFTHAADAMARMVLRNALFFGRQRVNDLVIPWTTYTSPELAHIGLYPREAEERGLAIDTFTLPFHDLDRALLDGESEGFLQVHVKRGSDRILGGTVVAAHAGDLVGYLSLAMRQNLGLAAFSETVFPYPTQGEVFRKAGDAYQRTRLTDWARRFFGLWFKIFS
jgi:pyruvate/2-oxoglutarate dehydrogenase complex dihydrolipoamide dehydrogenase (E3) component